MLNLFVRIIRRLYKLGYSLSDCTPPPGEKGLKWKGLIDQSRELTEKGGFDTQVHLVYLLIIFLQHGQQYGRS